MRISTTLAPTIFALVLMTGLAAPAFSQENIHQDRIQQTVTSNGLCPPPPWRCR